MNPAERWIIRDYVHRKWTFYFLGAVIHMVAMLASWWIEPIILMGIFLGSAVVLNFDLAQGGNTITRTLLSLPITAAQLGRCWRFATFSLPVIAGFLILSLSAIIAGFYGAPLLNVGSFVITAVTQTLLLGLVFFIITGLPRRGGLAASFPKKLSQIAFGLLTAC